MSFIFPLILFAVPVAVVLTSAYIQYKRNYRKMIKEAITDWKYQRQNSRIYKWKEKAKRWKEELKKPVKVRFD